ncbi:MAG TPA: glycine--tRNA ligase subunit beta, partial [Elusimicrobiota bacterium]|nr:glycine--tRNA ligase subunit beta [Elusimicrobiota bacterium]
MSKSAGKTAILEIGTESLPARFLLPTLRQLEEKAAELLKAERLEFESARALGTPMRQALILSGVKDKSAEAVQE